MMRTDLAPGIFTIASLLDIDECEVLIRRADASGFAAAPIAAAAGIKIDVSARNNDRCIFDDEVLAQELWRRAASCVPALGGRQAVGLNERFRLYRYLPGQRFVWHADMPFRRSGGEISLLTFMVYLNDGYEGGATRFENIKVAGRAGLGLIFEHGLIHEGAEVLAGAKYVLRSDVMFA